MYVQPFVYDTSSSGLLAATFVDHLGEPKSTSSTTRNPGLVLSKGAGAPAGSTAGAYIRNYTGTSLSTLAYDYHVGGQCTKSPYFVVVTSDSVTHIVGGCSSGAITALTAPALGWKHVLLDLVANPNLASPVIPAGATVSSITLVLSDGPELDPTAGGLVDIDNISVNGTIAAMGSYTRDE